MKSYTASPVSNDQDHPLGLSCGLAILAPDQPGNVNIKRTRKDIETLRAKVKELETERDEARRRYEEAQKKTETIAVSREAQSSLAK